ncbi:hypothetical protein DFH11DRAFT_1743052 [Phellopilus nigrolimitatus]|nr:hypothetical protein DFH11DRAFT_1743052 [Phellopilus nigrolimitatus]
MLFSSERISANTLESYLFITFLLVFALAASSYVWVQEFARGLKKPKLFLDCVMIVSSVGPSFPWSSPWPSMLSSAPSPSASHSRAASKSTRSTKPARSRLSLVVEEVAGVDPADVRRLVPVCETRRETALCLAAVHALVRLDDGMIVGDPMEKVALEALGWKLLTGDRVASDSGTTVSGAELHTRRHFQFSSALKRMATVATVQKGPGSGRTLVSVKGGPETIRPMLARVPKEYDETYKYFTRRGSRVLALAGEEMDGTGNDKINHLAREQVESELNFAGFLVFHCPLKEDAVETLKMLAESSHRCIMITGDNPLTAVHVARDIEIVDREALILDLKENPGHEADLEWRTVDETKIIPVDPSTPFDQTLLDEYDICITGAALKQYESRPSWLTLVQHTWVYARVSPAQKELILTTLKSLGYVALMAGSGTNDVSALKHAHVGVALLDGTPDDLKKIAEHQRLERIKVYETQLKVSARFNQAPPPILPTLASAFPEIVETQVKAAAAQVSARRQNPMEKVRNSLLLWMFRSLNSITNSPADMDAEDDVPKIKLGDTSCAAPFTSKLSNVNSIAHIIRQGRCTLVATVQMYKILALNCLISALFPVHLACEEKLSRERNIFNLYVLLSILIRFAIHITSLVYITTLSNANEERGPIDLEAKFEPNLLNTAIYLLGLYQQVSTFSINFQGRPFREGIRENPALYWGLVGASAVAFSGATDFVPEFSRWLQIVEMQTFFKFRLVAVMVVDFVGCWLTEIVCKHLFADLEPKEMITRVASAGNNAGSQRRLRGIRKRQQRRRNKRKVIDRVANHRRATDLAPTI